MLNPLLPIAGALIGVGTGTMTSESILMTPKAICLFYVGVAKTCYVSTGTKRIACVVDALACGTALIPGPHQGPFIVACGAASRGANKLEIKSRRFD
jgi:hypothetical protein